jgi:LuxR family maltose regulon positive regulatory protein
MVESVHKHAITPPAFEATRLHRERLVDVLHANVPRKLIVIAAPAGYGKTTLLADFTAHTELPVCWVRLTEADTDLMRLAAVLAASLQRRFRRLRGQPDLGSLVGSPPEAVARSFADTIDVMVSESFVVALDDIHLINRSRDVLAFLDAFLSNLPEQVTLVAAGREVPEVSLAKLMAEGSLAGLGPHDLAFDADELIALGKKYAGVELTPAQAERLLDETRGWITGVLLSGLLTSRTLGDIVQASRPMVYEYLALVVLSRQPDDLRRFMLDSSVLPVMSADACNEVLQRTDSDRCLVNLVRSGLFVTATEDSPRTYEFHPQFRVFLLDTMKDADPGRLRSLRLRAAAFLAARGAPEHAIELFIDAEAPRRAASLAEKHAQSMSRSGRVATLAGWAERLAPTGAAIPRVMLALGSAYGDQGNLDRTDEALQAAEKMLDARSSSSLRVALENLRGMLAYRRGEYDRALECARSAMTRMGDVREATVRATGYRIQAMAIAGLKGDLNESEQLLEKAIDQCGCGDDPYALASALADLSTVQTRQGKAHQAYATSLRTIEVLQGIGAPYPLATAYNNLAVDLHLQGRYVESMDSFMEAAKFARQAASPHRETVVLFGQADLFSDMDLALQAAELYAQGLSLATRLTNNNLLGYGCVQTSVLHRRRGGAGLAHEWLRRAIALEGEGPHSATVEVQLAALEAATVPEAAEARLSGLLALRDGSLDAGEMTAALYFLARAAFASGDPEVAGRRLADALTWAGSHGTEQLLAGEMAFDSAFWDFARRNLGANPVMAVVVQRIEMSRATAQQYQDALPEETRRVGIALAALGRSSVHLGDKELTELKNLPREVLFFLVEHQTAERELLMDTFWPHYNPGRQISNLHTAIYTLRRTLGREAISQSGTQYSLSVREPVEYDTANFERAADVALALPPGDPRRLFALTAALNLYRGQFLPDFLSEWVIERRRELELRYLDLLASHAEEALVRDQPQKALATLRQALDLDPLRDDTNLRYLEALGRLGRRSEVVAHYQRYVRLLSDELGLDPPDKARELYRRLIG